MRITPYVNWFTNQTAVLPDGRKGGLNNDGLGAAAAIPNSQPQADAGLAQLATSGNVVTLDGTNSSDADNDALDFQWSQVQNGAPAVVLDTTDPKKPTFKAPMVPNETDLKFQLIVVDGTALLKKHNPGNSRSEPSTVTVTVQPPQQ